MLEMFSLYSLGLFLIEFRDLELEALILITLGRKTGSSEGVNCYQYKKKAAYKWMSDVSINRNPWSCGFLVFINEIIYSYTK